MLFTECNYFCSEHNERCIRPKNHFGLHLCPFHCSGSNDYGMTDKDKGEHLKFIKMEKKK